MPPGKRSKEATWKESELKDTLKEINDERARDGKSRRKREDGDEKGKHESSQRRSEKDRDRDKDRNRRDQDDRKPRDDRDREKDRERKHRDDKERDSERRHRDDKDRDRERRHGDDKDKERERRRRDEKERDGDRKHRDDKDRDGERKHRDDKEKRDRDRDNKPRDEKRDRDDRDRRHRDDKGDGERRKHRDDDKDRHRKDDREDKRRDDDRDRMHRDDKDRERDRKHRDEKDKDRDRRHRDDKDRDRKHRDEEDKERRHRDDKDRERRHRGDDRDKKHRDEDKDRERRHRDDKDKHDDGDKRRRRDEEDRKHRDDKKERRDEEESDRRRKDKEEEKSRSSKQKEESGNKGGSSKNKTDEPEEKIEAKRTKPVSAKPSKKEEEPEEDDYGGYDDDDFEDYDDDFEDDDGGEEPEEKFNKMGRAKNGNTNREMEDLFDALNEENDRLLSDSRKSNWSDSTEEERQGSNRPVTGKPRSFVNFVAAKQRDMNQKVANKARKRCTELLNIIELDTVHFTLFDLPPVKEYDLYMSSFGRTNAQQVYIQTNDDNLERDTQTEDIETADMWCQHPPEGARGCGGKTASTEGDNDKESAASKVDEGRLSLFLQRACQVVEKLINEENAKSSYTEKSAAFSCSEAYTGLRSVEVFQSRKVSRCHFSNTDSSMLLTMHTEPTKVIDKKLDKYGMIGVWNINDPSQPQKIVASASMPTCCCYSPVKATMVFGGMLDGSLVAWDLREPPTMHHSYMCGGQDWLLRFPTYNTAGVLKYENHNSPITAIVPILQDNKKSTAQESGTGLSFQLATLDKTGIINLWVVAEILETSMAGSESDLGLSPNGKIKLLKSSSITLNSPIKSDLGSSLCTLDLKLNTVNHNHLYIATDAGLIIHSTRFGSQKTVPRSYMSDDSTPCDVTSLDLHPFGHSVLLAGYEDGSVRLFHLSTELPIITWESSTNGAAVSRVLWSRSCAYIIFILDSNSIVHMWDLLRNDAEPMTSEQVMEKDSKLVDIALSEEEQSNARPKMVLSYEDGTIQVHLLSSHVSNLQPGENEQFSRFVEQL